MVPDLSVGSGLIVSPVGVVADVDAAAQGRIAAVDDTTRILEVGRLDGRMRRINRLLLTALLVQTFAALPAY